MEEIEKPTTHIVKWTDGEHNWSMVIKPGKVDILTTMPLPESTLRSHSESWTAAFNFINGTFQKKKDAE